MSTARKIASALRKRALRVRPVSDNPYATHLPVLTALSGVMPIRKVLELGAGPFSTALFLDREAFPDLERLVSYEDDTEWLPVVQQAIDTTDPRLDLRMVEAVRDSVPTGHLDDFDLIFIDDSRLPAERSQTIEAVAVQRPRGLVAIHDYEQRPYRSAAAVYDNQFIFQTFTPQVGVLWNGSATLTSGLRKAAIAIEGNRSTPVTDRTKWLAALKRTTG